MDRIVASSYWNELDPDAREVARVLDARLSVPVREMGAARARAMLDSQPRQPLTRVHDVAERFVSARSRGVRVRIYRPVEPTLSGPGEPALLYMHGGGFVLGTLDGADELCRALAVASGAVVISVDYRLAPENPFPAALDDCRDVYTWVCRDASGLGIDLGRIAVGGDSAGGNLAAALCLWLRETSLPMPVAQILAYPAVDCGFDRPSWTDYADGPLLTTADARWCWEQYVRNSGPGAPSHLAAPMLADSLHGLPPAHIATAAVDPLRDDAEAYARRLTDDGVAVRAIRYPGVFHGFFTEIGLFARTEHAVADASESLRAAFGTSRS